MAICHILWSSYLNNILSCRNVVIERESGKNIPFNLYQFDGAEMALDFPIGQTGNEINVRAFKLFPVNICPALAAGNFFSSDM